MLTNEMKRVALRLLKALEYPGIGNTRMYVEKGMWNELANDKFNPLHHHDKSVDQFRRSYLAQEFLRKADFLDTGIDRAQVARDGFLSCERQCFHANRHLDKFLHYPVLETEVDRRFYEYILVARDWVKKTLGPLPADLSGRFGPGAVFESAKWSVRQSMTSYDKLRNSPCVTSKMPSALIDHIVWQTAYASAWSHACPARYFPQVPGNRFTTVPKDATKDRGIAVEPGVNIVGQLAVGDVLKDRLKRRGIDLRGTEDRFLPVLRALGLELGRPWKGQILHREMAKEASVSCSHSTIDLSNASDTLSLNLVKLLLPDDWFDLLSDLRSPYTRFSHTGKKADERWYYLEKFSSMGNGFTFELETLVFLSLAKAVGGTIGVDSFVYGDDIIVPDRITADLLAVLKFAGLTPNEGKTFTGACNFRESCGGDFFFGHDVRPFYIKESPDDPAAWITIANNLRHWSLKWEMPELMAVRASVLDNIPADIRRCRGPEELGDLVIHDDIGQWNTTIRGSIRYIRAWRPILSKKYL